MDKGWNINYTNMVKYTCQTQKLLILQVVVGNGRGENAGDHI